MIMCVAAFRGMVNNPTKAVRDTLVNQCAQILACYRKNCASPSSAGQVLNTQPADITSTVTRWNTLFIQSACCLPADPPGVHEAVTGLSELLAEE